VNGIDTTPREFSIACKSLRDLTKCDIYGVYNATGPAARWRHTEGGGCAWERLQNIGFDLGQCFGDTLDLTLRSQIEGTRFAELFRELTWDPWNGCTVSLLSLFIQAYRWPGNRIHVVAHSQGNLIASNALMLCSMLIGNKKVRVHPPSEGIKVFAVAPPTLTWPVNPKMTHTDYVHLFDFVAHLGRLQQLVRLAAPVNPIAKVGAAERLFDTRNLKITKASAEHSLRSYLEDVELLEDLRRELGTFRYGERTLKELIWGT